ncbi:uncharacterized protein LOC112595037 [Melanaphis sacchari]|uniref:uncharacterized protein LOC112595037 n=1 Tax=Melanaphis sacchari TaxID=742174 RepID=UPI000DC13047|nr:uncharacterized protein LOC112595037 [Melanaphis sacchari]
MPRTKRRAAKRSTVETNSTAVNATMGNPSKTMKDILCEFDCEKQNIENYFFAIFENYRNLIENSFLMTKMNIGDLLHSNLYDTIFKQYLTKSNHVTKELEQPSRPITKYAENRMTRQKSVSVSVFKTNGSTASKTVIKCCSTTHIDDDQPVLTGIIESKFKTPINQLPLSSLATITPKLNMNEPMSMMRRPNQGEIALSMTGSPLMVSSVSRDDMATVSVPLANGNVLSILPRVGSTMDISFDEQTKSELLILKKNIEGLLKMNEGV